LAAIEVKWSHRIDESDITSLKQCAEDLKDKLLFSVIIYSGAEIVPIASKIVAIPFPVFLELGCRYPSLAKPN
jgi:predicted AAA+ superfamily ATPase